MTRWPNSSAPPTDGRIEYRYVDAVKLAGHSCPTVAAAYWMTLKALAFLYPDALPQRGNIRVDFRADHLSGVTGVIANVVALLTGATHDTGFKGMAGRFDRRKLLYFLADISEEIRFTRLDTGAAVEVAANCKAFPSRPDTPELMQKCLEGKATPTRRPRSARTGRRGCAPCCWSTATIPRYFCCRRAAERADLPASGCANGALPCSP
jgi:hypothetical protein